MQLPTPTLRPDREWHGQRFVFSQAKNAEWETAHEANAPATDSSNSTTATTTHAVRVRSGWEVRDTGVAANTNNVASVRVLRPTNTTPVEGEAVVCSADVYFLFVVVGGSNAIIIQCGGDEDGDDVISRFLMFDDSE